MTWPEVRLSRVARTISGAGFPVSDQGLAEGDFPFVKVSDIAAAPVAGLSTAANWVTRTTAKSLGAREVPVGATLLPKVGAALLNNNRAHVLTPCVVDNNVMAVVPQKGCDRFWYWVLRATDMGLLSGGGTLPFITDGDVRALRVPMPPLDEQRRIADYLDECVPTLDGIIADRVQQVSLLRTRLEAERDRAFGACEAPRVALRYVVDFFSDGDWIESPYITDIGIRLIQTGNIGVGGYKDQGYRYITSQTFAELSCTEVFPNDLLISRLSPPVGRACLAPDLGERMIVSVDVAIVRSSRVSHSFLAQYMSSPKYLAEVDLASRGATMARISRSQLGGFKVPVPSEVEQKRVASLLAEHQAAAADATELLQGSIALLRERKQALISAAVTGAFDVTTTRSAG